MATSYRSCTWVESASYTRYKAQLNTLYKQARNQMTALVKEINNLGTKRYNKTTMAYYNDKKAKLQKVINDLVTKLAIQPVSEWQYNRDIWYRQWVAMSPKDYRFQDLTENLIDADVQIAQSKTRTGGLTVKAINKIESDWYAKYNSRVKAAKPTVGSYVKVSSTSAYKLS